jgi:hypothetical protein
MFKCNECKKISVPKSKCFKVSIETRKRVYENPETGVPTYGFETVREQNLCATCYEKYLKAHTETNRIAKAKQDTVDKELALQNLKAPIIAPRLVRMPEPRFSNRRRNNR